MKAPAATMPPPYTNWAMVMPWSRDRRQTTAMECDPITPTPTPTRGVPTTTPTRTTTLTPTRMATDSCVADCDADEQVEIDELLRAVSIALGDALVTTCEEADRDAHDPHRSVRVAETPQAGEQLVQADGPRILVASVGHQHHGVGVVPAVATHRLPVGRERRVVQARAAVGEARQLGGPLAQGVPLGAAEAQVVEAPDRLQDPPVLAGAALVDGEDPQADPGVVGQEREPDPRRVGEEVHPRAPA